MLKIGKSHSVVIIPHRNKIAIDVLQRALINFIEEEVNLMPGNQKNSGSVNMARGWLYRTNYVADALWAERYGYKNPECKDKNLEDHFEDESL